MRETGTGQQVAKFHERLMMMMMIMNISCRCNQALEVIAGLFCLVTFKAYWTCPVLLFYLAIYLSENREKSRKLSVMLSETRNWWLLKRQRASQSLDLV